MVNDIVGSLQKLKLAGIDRFKMLRYYGFVSHTIAQIYDVHSHFVNSRKKSESQGFSQNANNRLKNFKDYYIDKDSNAMLKRAGDFYKINTHLFEYPPHIVFISNYLPRYDITAADYRLYNILKILLANNCKIEYVYCGKTQNDVRFQKVFKGDIKFKFIPLNRREFTKAINELTCENLWITSLWNIEYFRSMVQLTTELRNLNPSFKIIIDTMDFHFKEFIRKYNLNKDLKDLALANDFLELEKVLYMKADKLIVVSEKEKKDIRKKISGIRNFEIVPTIHEISAFTRPYHKRRNICFVGHFGTRHNVDAVIYFINHIFQLILKKNSREEFHIIGIYSQGYKKVFDFQNVRVIGRLKDLHKALTYYKLFVCPMNYGAGIKGKIGDAIAAGVPVVTTSLGAEGFPLSNGKEWFIADSPTKFAEKCNLCLNDPVLWHNFSVKARLAIAENFSPGIISERLANVLLQ